MYNDIRQVLNKSFKLSPKLQSYHIDNKRIYHIVNHPSSKERCLVEWTDQYGEQFSSYPQDKILKLFNDGHWVLIDDIKYIEDD